MQALVLHGETHFMVELEWSRDHRRWFLVRVDPNPPDSAVTLLLYRHAIAMAAEEIQPDRGGTMSNESPERDRVAREETLAAVGGVAEAFARWQERVAYLIDHMCWMAQTVHHAHHRDAENESRTWQTCTCSLCSSTVRAIRGEK